MSTQHFKSSSQHIIITSFSKMVSQHCVRMWDPPNVFFITASINDLSMWDMYACHLVIPHCVSHVAWKTTLCNNIGPTKTEISIKTFFNIFGCTSTWSFVDSFCFCSPFIQMVKEKQSLFSIRNSPSLQISRGPVFPTDPQYSSPPTGYQ